MRRSVASFLAVIVAAGCSSSSASDGGLPSDAGQSTMSDAGPDGGIRDAGTDAGASVDAGSDAGISKDAGMDAGSGMDAGKMCTNPATDCPSTGTACVTASCGSSGTCTSANAAAGAACSDSGGNVCDGNGHCIGCLSPFDCPVPTAECVATTCNNNVCGTSNVPAGAPCANGGSFCDGNAHCVACLSPANCPAQTTACVTNTCLANACGTVYAAQGTACSDSGGNVCNSRGHCVECNSASDCGGSDSCVNGACVQCLDDLSNIGTGDFQVSFTIQTTQSDNEVALYNQRSGCSPGNFWDVRMTQNDIVLETDSLPNGGDPLDSFASGCTTVNDGNAHQVIAQRVSGQLSVYVDGLLDTSTTSTADWGVLPALATGTDICVGIDDTMTFDTTKGSLSNFCAATAFPPITGAQSSSCN